MSKAVVVSKRAIAIALSKRAIAAVVKGMFNLLLYLADTVTASDTAAKNLGKGVSDSAAASDILSRVVVFVRSFSDAATITDAASKVAGKAVTDSAAASDAMLKESGKGLSDSATSSDAGTLLNQDYVSDPFYFADDYVGAKRTF